MVFKQEAVFISHAQWQIARRLANGERETHLKQVYRIPDHEFELAREQARILRANPIDKNV